MSTTAADPVYVTSGLVRLTRPQLIGTMTGLLLAALLAAIDQTIVGTAEPRIIASLQGFDRYPWVATIYMLTSTVSVPIFASLSDRYGRKPFFMLGATAFVVSSALCGAAGEFTFLPIDGMGQLIVFRGLQGVGGGATRVVSLFAVSAVMLGALLYAESKAAEPIIPLTFFTQPVIAVCSVAAFILGVGMFGTIIYLPLFMQGVLGVSATQSGNLLTPLLMGVVVASIIGGQAISRTGEYKMLGVVGSVLVAVGMILFARMDAATTRLYVAAAMGIAGVGMGLLQPVYTLAVQNA